MITRYCKPLLTNYWSFSIVCAFFLVLQWYKLMHLAPPPEYIWDNVVQWNWARNFVLGKTEDFIANSHHMLRWGNWGFSALLIALFSDHVFFYYLATILPATLAGLLFSYFVWRYIGVTYALVFCLMWYFDRELFRATFQLLPTGSALLPLAICLLLTAQVVVKKRLTNTMTLFITLTSFWIYGVKETYLAFIPGVLWALYVVGGWRPIVQFSVIFILAYILETFFFNLISSEVSLLGRVWMLVHDGHHVNLMFENAGLVQQQEKYPDAGLTLRWITPLGLTSIIFFPAYIIALLVLAKQYKNASANTLIAPYAVALMLLSFFIFTTFFIISISPLRLGQPLVSRYIAVNIPFAYLIILWFCQNQFADSSYKIKFALFAILPFYFSHSYHRMNAYPRISFVQHANSYSVFAQKMAEFDCIRSKQLSIVRNRLDMIPLAERSEKLSSIINNPNHIITDGSWFSVTSENGQCEKPYSIRRTAVQRY